jgi:outer membrane lipoprotein-sorting protein
MTRIVTIALAIAVPVVAQTLAAQTLNDTFDRMDKAAAQLKSITAGINRDVHTAIINDDEIDKGTFHMKREKSHGVLMLIEFTGAAARHVALDDSTVTVYNPKINNAQVFEIGAKKQMVEQFLLLGFGATSAELKQSYDVSWVGAEAVDGQQTGHLKLVPKAPDASQKMSGAELWISASSASNGLPVQQKILFTNGDYWLVKYSDIRMNPRVSDDTFKLKLPKGVQIDHPRF